MKKKHNEFEYLPKIENAENMENVRTHLQKGKRKSFTLSRLLLLASCNAFFRLSLCEEMCGIIIVCVYSIRVNKWCNLSDTIELLLSSRYIFSKIWIDLSYIFLFFPYVTFIYFGWTRTKAKAQQVFELFVLRSHVLLHLLMTGLNICFASDVNK